MLYTDGLIERRDETLDAGFARLRDALRRVHGQPPEAFASELLDALRPDRGFGDDVAVLVCALGPVGTEPLALELDAQPGQPRGGAARARALAGGEWRPGVGGL